MKNATENGRGGLVAAAVIMLASALAIVTIPESGVFGIVAAAGAVAYVISAKRSPLFLIVPSAALAVLLVRDAKADFTVTATVLVAAAVSGAVLRSGGSFHPALMAFIAAGTLEAALLFAELYLESGITLSDVGDIFAYELAEVVRSAVSSAQSAISEDQAYEILAMYESSADYIALCLPAIFGLCVSAVGAISLRVCGILHTVSRSGEYSMPRRRASVSTVFAVLYIAAMLIFAVDETGVAGVAAGSIVAFMIIPAFVAGLSSMRRGISRGGRFFRIRTSLIIAAVILTVASPALIVILLSFIGVTAAFGRTRGIGKGGSVGE